MTESPKPGSSCPPSERLAQRASPSDDGGATPSSRRGLALLRAGAIAGCGSNPDVDGSGDGAVAQTTGSAGGGGAGCSAGTRKCGADCVDLASDAAHCGACVV